MKRHSLKIVAQSGAGLLTMGDILACGLRGLGFFLCTDREYPSLIKGGQSCFTLNFGTEPVHSLEGKADLLLAVDKISLVHYFDTLRDGGTLVHGYERQTGIKDILEQGESRKIGVVDLPTRKIAAQMGGNELMANMVLLGMVWKVWGLPYDALKQEVEKRFASKPKLLAIDLKCLEAGYGGVETKEAIPLPQNQQPTHLLDGNHALALGAVHGGVRCFFAYPMSPASTILTHMADMAAAHHLTLKQAEDEISAVQMTLGANYMGTRALTATSGGGFDLMTETVSLAGIIETPLVIVLAQRPGPATGLPTWTGQGDLNLALFSGHGEYARVVLACSDPSDCFELIQQALNLSEEYQVPVILLTEKVIAESKMTVPPLQQGTVPIRRGLVEGADLEHLENTDRYKMTESGLSQRWLPGSSAAYYFANGDEHAEDGRLTEDAEPAGAMYAKRIRKLKLIAEGLPEPQVLGTEGGAEISFVGWGSSRCVMQDVIAKYEAQGVSVNYLHYSHLWPLKTERLQQFFAENKNVHLIEGNHDGQLGGLIRKETGLEFKNKFLKWNGRPFFLEEVRDYITQHKV